MNGWICSNFLLLVFYPTDIVEKILGDDIVDETDEYVDSNQEVKVERAETFEWARLRLLDSKIVDQMLSPSEVQAVTAHLRMNYASTVKLLTDTQLARLVSTTPVVTLEAAKQELGEALPKDLLYKKGTPSDTCTLILSGKITILVGDEDFRSDLSSWSVLAKSALEKSEYAPDFTAFVSDGPCRCLRLTHKDFVAAVDASAVERTMAENRIGNRATLSVASNDGAGSVGDQGSTTSSEVPNRREKLLAKLFKKESIDNPIVAELSPDLDLDTNKETVVRFEEDKSGDGIVGVGSKDTDDEKVETINV